MPDRHALLGPSSAHRWLACTASPRYEEQFGDGKASVYAEEGTLAHKICELMVGVRFGLSTQEKMDKAMSQLKQQELYSDEMLRTAEFYTDYLSEKANTFHSTPFVRPEVRVEFTEFVPEGFGTCDCIMIGDDRLHITDYKHGKGVRVDSKDNPQMKLYALGALIKYRPLYKIERVSMAIVQPRISDDVSEFEMSADDLMKWAEEYVRPRAKAAYDGTGTFCPGDHCRFCKGKIQCRARAEKYSAYADFKDFIPVDNLPADKREEAIRTNTGMPKLLTNRELAELLPVARDLKQWASELEEYIRGAMLDGQQFPGWKLVDGRSSRSFKDENKVKQLMLIAFGASEKDLYTEPKFKSVADIEKQFGKAKVGKVLKDQILKTPGKPTLAPESDGRAEFSAAGSDFAGVTTSK